MITEDYVSFETAKLLKEKRFNEWCNSYFISDNEIALISNRRDFNNHGVYLSAPTQQMTMKWLREVHNIFIVIEPHMYDYINEKNSSYVASLWQGDNYYENIISKDCPTYEETVEAAIKYCLENLI
jgi:hypothetical protein